MGRLGAVWERLGAILGRPGAVLELLWAVLGRLGSIDVRDCRNSKKPAKNLRKSMNLATSELLWGVLGNVLGASWACLGLS